MALLFVGVAASSAFQHAHDVVLKPGQTTKVGDYDVTYVRPTSSIGTRAGSLEKIAFGAVLDVPQERQARHDAAPVEGLLPVAGRRATSARSAASSRARRRARSACRPACAATSGPRCRPTSRRCARSSTRATRPSARSTARSPPQMQAQLLGQALAGLVAALPHASRRPRTSGCISSPLVAWIWIGGLVVFAGGLIALWPAGDPATRRVRGALRRPRRARARPRVACPAGDRARGRPRAADRHRRPDASSCVLVSAPLRGGASARAEERDELAPRATSRPRARPSTARSATPSSTTAPASCPRPTGARSTASCAPRRSRSCASSTSCRRTDGVPAKLATRRATIAAMELLFSVIQVVDRRSS